jgi:hypothetical protein
VLGRNTHFPNVPASARFARGGQEHFEDGVLKGQLSSLDLVKKMPSRSAHITDQRQLEELIRRAVGLQASGR